MEHSRDDAVHKSPHKMFDIQYTLMPLRVYFTPVLHSKTPHVVTVLRPDSDNVVTILLPTGGSGRLQNLVSVPPWFLHSDCV